MALPPRHDLSQSRVSREREQAERGESSDVHELIREKQFQNKDMIRKTLLFGSCALMALGAMAESLTPEEALQRLMSDGPAKKVRALGTTPRLAYTSMAEDGAPATYVFNREEGGFLVVSADNQATALLGYTDQGSFEEGSIPPELAYWLGEYGRQIAAARAAGGDAVNGNPVFPADWTPVEPIMKSKWNQTAPYSDMCPEYQGRSCVTGCVATAMAMVMKSFEYPKRGTGSISFNSNQYIGNLSMDFSEQDFDWDNMLDQYVAGSYSQTEADAVAYLMKACGYATEMSYTPSLSGAVTGLVGRALIQNFGYDTGLNIQNRGSFSATEWNKMVYDNISKIGPVVWSANSSTGGHCFVSDGYDGDGYFHFNWGWGGLCDGYYLLNALNPSSQGAGGYYGGYNYMQVGIFGIQPDTGAGTPIQVGTISTPGYLEIRNARSVVQFAVVDGDWGTWGNNSMKTLDIVFGFCIEAADGREMEPLYQDCTSYNSLELSPGAWLQGPGFIPMGRVPSTLADGKYKLTFMIRNAVGDPQWRRVNLPYGNADYAYFTKEGASYEFETFAAARLTVTDAKVVTPLYYNNPCEIAITVENPTDYELTTAVMPRLLLDGKIQYESDSRGVTVAPHSSTVVTFPFTFTRQTGAQIPTVSKSVEFDLQMWDFLAGKEYGNYGKVEMSRSSASARMNMSDFRITNAESSPEEGVYDINNFSSIGVSGNITVINGYVASPIILTLDEMDAATGEVAGAVEEITLPGLIALESGQESEFYTSFSLPSYTTTNYYRLNCYYLNGINRVLLGSLRLGASSGVEGVMSDEGVALYVADGVLHATAASGISRLEVRDLNGVDVNIVAQKDGMSASASLASLDKGVYIATMADNDGNVRTVKFVR